MSFLPSVPCLAVPGMLKAPEFKIFPPGARFLAIHTGCPATRSGRVNCCASVVPGRRTRALNGNPVLTSTNPLSDQLFITNDSGANFFVEGRRYVTAPVKLCRVSKSEEA